MNAKLIGTAFLACTAMTPVAALAQLSIGISVRLAPPPLPVYAQPPLPGPDYLWNPGYWAWDGYAEAYYWVPGTWVHAPRPGLLWTPPWWGWSDGAYVFHAGYWGPHIGFYGGVAYGFGYTGFGYRGGYWNGGHWFYNRTVNHITDVHIINVYETNVSNYVSRVSYNGGPGGVRAQPRPEDQQAARDQHIAPTSYQQNHVRTARADPQAYATNNHGHPLVAATPHALTGQGIGAATNRSSIASMRGEPGGEPDRTHQHGPTPGGEVAQAGGTRTPQDRRAPPDRFAGDPGNAGRDPRLDTPRSAVPGHHADSGRSVDAGDRSFGRAPFASPDRHAHGGAEPFVSAQHASQPHMRKPPHAPEP